MPPVVLFVVFWHEGFDSGMGHYVDPIAGVVDQLLGLFGGLKRDDFVGKGATGMVFQ